MEIYRNDTNREVAFTFGENITDATVTLKGVDNGADYVMNDVDIDDNVVKFTVPLRFAKYDASIRANVEYEYVEDTLPYTDSAESVVKVSTPILPLDEVRQILTTPGFIQNISAQDVKDIERATRYIIQSNTGQDFGHYNEVRRFRSDSNLGLVELPGRLIKANKLNGTTLNTELFTTPNKYNLYRYPTRAYADWDGSPIVANGVIYNPRSDTFEGRRAFESVNTSIDGEWGWNGVPEDVQEAAKLLINDYACQESAYRDRYLGVMKAADWEINFRTGAWSMTGNARADQLLKKYIITGGHGVL